MYSSVKIWKVKIEGITQKKNNLKVLVAILMCLLNKGTCISKLRWFLSFKTDLTNFKLPTHVFEMIDQLLTCIRFRNLNILELKYNVRVYL